MALTDYDDPQLAAVAALVRAAVHNDLDPSVLAEVYEDPRELGEMTNTRVPALAVYRASEKRAHHGSGVYVDRVTVRFDYVLCDVSPAKRAAYWPTLRRVWKSIADAMAAGKHTAATGDAEVLELAGVEVDDESPKVSYTFAKLPGAGNTYPYFRGEITADFFPDATDVTALDDFLTHFTAFAKPGDTEHTALISALAGDDPLDSDHLANDTTTLPAFGS